MGTEKGHRVGYISQMTGHAAVPFEVMVIKAGDKR